jgi:pyridoxal phosphate enzyme (YggS family)
MSDSLIATRLTQVRARIAQACARVSRSPACVQLMLVTKTVSSERLYSALTCGECLFGENKVQEGLAKAEALRHTAAQWEFIGHLQTNKIKDVLRFANRIQSLDRLDLAEKLNQRLLTEQRRLPVLIQVNTSYENSKYGVLPEHTLDLIQRIAELSQLQIEGLMTIGAFSAQESIVRDCFKRLRELQGQASALGLEAARWDTLSMGMSGDFEWAIEEGATLIRVGSLIFGERPRP